MKTKQILGLIFGVILLTTGVFMSEAKAKNFKPGMNRVEFQSEGEKMVGTLFLPANYQEGDKLPAVVIVGSLTSVKEQMSALYGKKLSEQGLAALAFDYRFFGESGGLPRFFESPEKHIADISSAVTYLQTLPMIDRKRIGGLGIRTGSGYMGVAASRDKGIKSLAAVALWIPTAESNLLLYGGDDGVQKRKEAGRQALAKYAQSKRVDYLLAYSNKPDDPTASHSGTMEYYFDKSRGLIPAWTNKFAVMSWEEWLDYSPLSAAEKITVPTLMIHSDNAALPEAAKKFYDQIKAEKNLIWTKDAHFDFYDQEPVVSNAVKAVADHFRRSLKK